MTVAEEVAWKGRTRTTPPRGGSILVKLEAGGR